MFLVVVRNGSDVRKVFVTDKAGAIKYLTAPNPPEVYNIKPQGQGQFLLTRQRINLASAVTQEVVVDAELESDV